MVMGVGQERRVLLVPLSVCERGHLPSTNMVIVKTSGRVLVDQCRKLIKSVRMIFAGDFARSLPDPQLQV